MVKRKKVAPPVYRPISARRLGRLLSTIGEGIDCDICRDMGRFYSRFDQIRAARRLYRRRRRYW